MDKLNLMTYGVIGFISAFVFGVLLNVGWEVFFINFFIGFGCTAFNSIKKEYPTLYAILNFGLPVVIAGIIAALCIHFSIG